MKAAILCLPVAVVACGHEPGGGVTVTDSAGVRMTITADADRRFATVDLQPLLSLGGPDVTGATQFSRIAGLHVDARGNLWVADGGSCELRLFHADGAHWKTRGGMGGGPGEFRRVRLLGAFAGDSVAFWDDRLGRLTVFDADGELARMVPLPPGAEAAPRAYDVFEDGALLVQFPRFVAGASLRTGQLLWDTTYLERLDSRLLHRESLGLAAGPTWLWTGHSQIPLPFTVNPAFTVSGEALYLAAGPDHRIRVVRPGGRTEIFGVARAPRETGPGDLTTYAEFMRDALPPAQIEEYLSVLEHPQRPRFLPAYASIVVAGDGAVWAARYSPNRFEAISWDVFAPDHRWLGQVETPTGFVLDVVAGDALVGVWRDTLGVEYVRRYRMRSP
jgi:hypothetical protein